MRSALGPLRTNVLSLHSFSPVGLASVARSSVRLGGGRSVNVSLDVRVSVHDSGLSILVMDCMKSFIMFRDHSPIKAMH